MRTTRFLLTDHAAVAISLPALFTRLLIALAIVCVVLPTASAAPRIVEERAQLALPSGSSQRVIVDMALYGGRLVLLTRPSPASTTREVWLYERTSLETWSQPTLIMSIDGPFHPQLGRVAIYSSTIALTFRNRLVIAQVRGNSWEVTADLTTPAGVGEMGSDVEISAGRVVVGGENGTNYQALMFLQGAGDVWAYTGRVIGGPVTQNHEDFFGGDIDVAVDTIVVGSPFYRPDGTPDGQVAVFTNNGGTWVRTATLTQPPDATLPLLQTPAFGNRVAVDGSPSANTLVVTSGHPETFHYYRRSGTGGWFWEGSFASADTITASNPSSPEISGNFIAQALQDTDRNDSGSAVIYRRAPQGIGLEIIAEMQQREPIRYWFEHVDLDATGGIVAVAASATSVPSRILIFELPFDPSQPAPIQDNFEDGNANGWNPFTVSSWTVAQGAGSRVYRQTNLTSEARSILGSADWTHQSIQAEIRPTAVDGSDRWSGLAVRFTDPANYYYVTVRSSGTVLLRKMVNGVFTTVASRPLTFALNQTYIVRLEAIGTRIRAYVNDLVVLEAVDDALTHGHVGLLTFRTRADFDNIVVTPNPRTELYRDDFLAGGTAMWRVTGTGAWAGPPDNPPDPDFPDPDASLRNFRQTSLNNGARAHTGVTTDDQVVEARVRPDQMTATGWFGLMARYVDDSNYYYLKVGSNGQASLRKLVNGAIFELTAAPLPISIGTTYTLRLETIGTVVRAYVNDRLLMEAVDASHASGRYGLVTYRATATFDDVLVLQP